MTPKKAIDDSVQPNVEMLTLLTYDTQRKGNALGRASVLKFTSCLKGMPDRPKYS